MNRDKLNAIKELANIKIEEILEALCIDYSARYNYVVARCPVHGGSRRDAWSWHVDKGMWSCWSRSCHEQYGSDIFGLIKAVRQTSFTEAVEFIKGFVDFNLSPSDIQKLKEQRQNREFIEATRYKTNEKTIFPSSCLDKLEYHDYLETRGYPRWLIKKYKIGACLQPGRYMSNRIVVPVLNVEREIIGFTGRTLEVDWKIKSIPKWKHSRGSWVSSNLFNIHRAAPFIRESGVVVLCEGPLDVLRFEEAGVRNSAAILGKKFFDSQMSILVGLGAFTIIDALDNDTAGRIGGSGIQKAARTLFDVIRAPIPEGRKDIGEMLVREIKNEFKGMVCFIS